MTVLVIDDDVEDYELFCDAARQINKNVICVYAQDGSAALNLLTSKKLTALPDMIFLDVNMPVMNGKDFLKAIKSLKGFGAIPVTMYTTTSNKWELKLYMDLGAKHIIVKPPGFDKLIEALTPILK